MAQHLLSEKEYTEYLDMKRRLAIRLSFPEIILSDTATKVLNIYRDNPDVTLREVSGMLGITSQAVQGHTKRLRKYGFLEIK